MPLRAGVVSAAAMALLGLLPLAMPSHTGAAANIAPDVSEIEGHLARARAAIGRDDMKTVWIETEAVLARDAAHPRALGYQALVRIAAGQENEAVRMLREALARDPAVFENHMHLAFAYARKGRRTQALAVLEAARPRFPDRTAVLDGMRQDILGVPDSAGGKPR